MSFPSPAAEGCAGGVGGAGGFWADERHASNRPAIRTPSLKAYAPTFRTPMSCLALPEEYRAEVGSVNLRVAHGARLKLSGLVVSRANRFTRGSVHVWCVAAETEEVDVVHLQQPRIRRAMWRMTGQAALVGLHRSMLKDKRPHGIG